MTSSTCSGGPGAAGAERVAVDANILSNPFDRRFVMASWEALGARAPVLPRVALELCGRMADGEVAHWGRRVLPHEERRGWSHTDEDRHRILHAVDAGTRAWVAEEIDAQLERPGDARPDTALAAVRMSPAQRGAASAIALAIPDDCFRGASPNNHHGDRMVIAEASVMGFAALASHNRISIDRRRVNAWLRKGVGLNSDLVWDADEAVEALLGRTGADPDEMPLRAVLLACLPEAPAPPGREAEIVGRFIDALGDSSFPSCAAGALRTWTGPRGLELAREAKQGLAASRARQTEARRLAKVRGAAAEAGWAPCR